MERVVKQDRDGQEGALSLEYGLLLAVVAAISIAKLLTPILAFPWY